MPPARTTTELELADTDLEEIGVAVIRGVLSPTETSDVRRRLLLAAEASEAAGVPTRGYAFDPDLGNRRIFHLVAWDPVFVELIRHPLALRFVKRALGDEFLISNFSANITAPRSREMFLHADQHYVPPPWGERPLAMNVAWLLDDFTDENGGTRIVPGSHRRGGPLPAGEAPQTVAIEGPAGSIMVMDGRLSHQTGANRTRDQERAALFGYYVRFWIRPQVNWNVSLPPEVAAGLDAEMRAWLGLDHGITEIPSPARRPSP
jgi:hypothetical protein